MKTLKFKNGNNVWFTSDTHFGHDAVIKYCNRPFKDVSEMNEALIENWNNVVKKDDFIFHLGDFAFGGSELWINTMKCLNGNIVLIRGNHDVKNYQDTYSKYFVNVENELYIIIENTQIYLNHYPFLTYAGIYRPNPTWQLFGHVHLCNVRENNVGKDYERLVNILPTQYDVGVDFNNYSPISFNALKERIRYQIENNVNQLYWMT